MRKIFSYGTELLILATVMLFQLSIPSVSAQSQKPESVKFCDLIRDTGKYDGKVVKTSASYSRTIHADVLSCKACPSTLNEQRSAEPLQARGLDQTSNNARILFRFLKKGVAADVTVIGLVHAQQDQKYGYYDAPIQIEIQKIETVEPDSASR